MYRQASLKLRAAGYVLHLGWMPGIFAYLHLPRKCPRLSVSIHRMKTACIIIALFGGLVGKALFADEAFRAVSRVAVTFVTPEKFTDIKDGGMQSDRPGDQVLGELKAQFESMARMCVADGQHLEVRVTDVDLAGDFEPWRGFEFGHIRILKDIYPPRMEFEFRLLGADGRVLREGRRRLQDPGYLLMTALPTNDALRYDKELIRSWMREEFKRSS